MAIKAFQRKFVLYVQELIHDSRTIGIVLLVCAAAALIVANLPFGEQVVGALSSESEALHHLLLPHSALHFINDGLMAVFFFLVGMEIRRELKVGELSSVKRAMLPIGAAIGGMVVPAIIFLLFNKGTDYKEGWGIPMATDIAFSLGVASLLGKMFPARLKIFLVGLAIIDDLGAILVIAVFYGSAIKAAFLLGAAAVIGLLVMLNKRKMAFGLLHIALGLLLWYLVFNSGIHATIAGVLFAFVIPFQQLHTLESKLHNLVNFGILPLFALANSAIILNGDMVSQLGSTLSLGIMVGLLLGKPLGITLACRMMVRQKMAELPYGISWAQLVGAGILAGIGFTMSIFIATLAFNIPAVEDLSKLSILVAVVLSVALTFAWFYLVVGKPKMSQKLEELAE